MTNSVSDVGSFLFSLSLRSLSRVCQRRFGNNENTVGHLLPLGFIAMTNDRPETCCGLL